MLKFIIHIILYNLFIHLNFVNNLLFKLWFIRLIIHESQRLCLPDLGNLEPGLKMSHTKNSQILF